MKIVSGIPAVGCSAGLTAAAELYAADHPKAVTLNDKAPFDEKTVVAKLGQRRYLYAANARAGVLLVVLGRYHGFRIRRIAKGTLDDIGMWWEWNGDSGEYPVNHKQECTGAAGFVRIARRGSIERCLAGCSSGGNLESAKMRDKITTALREGRHFGAGVLAFVGPGQPQVIVYDWMFVYLFDSWSPGRRPRWFAGPGLSKRARNRATAIYLREGELLRAQHHRAAELWGRICSAILAGEVRFSDTELAMWMNARYDDESARACEHLMRERSASKIAWVGQATAEVSYSRAARTRAVSTAT